MVLLGSVCVCVVDFTSFIKSDILHIGKSGREN